MIEIVKLLQVVAVNFMHGEGLLLVCKHKCAHFIFRLTAMVSTIQDSMVTRRKYDGVIVNHVNQLPDLLLVEAYCLLQDWILYRLDIVAASVQAHQVHESKVGQTPEFGNIIIHFVHNGDVILPLVEHGRVGILLCVLIMILPDAVPQDITVHKDSFVFVLRFNLFKNVVFVVFKSLEVACHFEHVVKTARDEGARSHSRQRWHFRLGCEEERVLGLVFPQFFEQLKLFASVCAAPIEH
jgi:hypothetical protein